MAPFFDDCTKEIIGACIEVHRHLGPGLLEGVYESCLCAELRSQGLRYDRQVFMPVHYKGEVLSALHRIDLIVEGKILVEIKVVERLHPVHVAQVLTYLQIANLDIGLLVNFNVAVMRDGLRRLTRRRPSERGDDSEHPRPL